MKQFWEKEQRSIVQLSEEKATVSEANDKQVKGKVNWNAKLKSMPSGGGSGIHEAFIYSIIAMEDCNVMSWTHEEMEELMKRIETLEDQVETLFLNKYFVKNHLTKIVKLSQTQNSNGPKKRK